MRYAGPVHLDWFLTISVSLHLSTARSFTGKYCFGIIDTAGAQNDFYLYRSGWYSAEEPTVRMPHWVDGRNAQERNMLINDRFQFRTFSNAARRRIVLEQRVPWQEKNLPRKLLRMVDLIMKVQTLVNCILSGWWNINWAPWLLLLVVKKMVKRLRVTV